MSRTERQLSIIELIKHNVIETQEQLVDGLRNMGYNVTQATVSRDIKELGLVKTNKDNNYRYAVLEPDADPLEKSDGKMMALYREVVENVTFVNNMVVVHSKPGTAGSIAAIIDSLSIPDKLGTLAGDDTVLVILRDNSSAELFCQRLKGML